MNVPASKRILKIINLALRGIMEVMIITAFGYWGYGLGEFLWMKVLYMLFAPLIGFGIWALIDFRHAGKQAEILRLIQEMVISGLAAYFVYIAGMQIFGLILAVVSVVHHILNPILGIRLIKAK